MFAACDGVREHVWRSCQPGQNGIIPAINNTCVCVCVDELLLSFTIRMIDDGWKGWGFSLFTPPWTETFHYHCVKISCRLCSQFPKFWHTSIADGLTPAQ